MCLKKLAPPTEGPLKPNPSINSLSHVITNRRVSDARAAPTQFYNSTSPYHCRVSTTSTTTSATSTTLRPCVIPHPISSDGLREAFRHNKTATQGRKMREIGDEVGKLKQLLYMKIVYNGASSCGPLRMPVYDTVRAPTTRSKLMANVASTTKHPWVKIHEALVPTPCLASRGSRPHDEFIRHHSDTKVTWQ